MSERRRTPAPGRTHLGRLLCVLGVVALVVFLVPQILVSLVITLPDLGDPRPPRESGWIVPDVNGGPVATAPVEDLDAEIEDLDLPVEDLDAPVMELE